MLRKVTILLVVAVLFALSAAPVLADGSGYAGVGQAFGAHVSQMAQAGHLGPEHHPGHHQGITGWHHDAVCQP
jgi:hypothetical protein